MINLRDSRVNRAIVESSKRLARESKKDSSAMKTLSVLATVFLPGTFIAVREESPRPLILLSTNYNPIRLYLARHFFISTPQLLMKWFHVNSGFIGQSHCLLRSL
jgi:hypothetical protein